MMFNKKVLAELSQDNKELKQANKELKFCHRELTKNLGETNNVLRALLDHLGLETSKTMSNISIKIKGDR